jgi:BolA protein
MELMSVAVTMRRKLESAFDPVSLDVIDESEQHRGHGGWREGGGTHFRVRMIAAAFGGQSRVARQRAVNKALADELAGPVHALALELRAPGES